MSAQSINARDVSGTFGILPKSTRLPKPVAELVAHGITSVIPVCTYAATKTLAQHLHHASRAKPSMGIADALTAMADSLGAEVHPYYGPAEDHVADNVPVAVYLGQLRREAGVEQRKAKRLEGESKSESMKEDLRHSDKEKAEAKADEAIAKQIEKMALHEEGKGGSFLSKAIDRVRPHLSGGAALAGAPLGGAILGGAGAPLGGAILGGKKQKSKSPLNGKARATSLYAALK